MNKNKFAYMRKEPAKPAPAGVRFKDENILVYEGNNMILKKVGQIDVQEQINSYRDGVDLGKMIERFKRGDTSAISRKQGFYADATECPTDLASAINAQRVAAEYMAAQKPTEEKVEVTKEKENVNENETASEQV